MKPLFITATDTGVGKTIATLVLGVLFKAKGLDVGMMKPVQCAGEDAQFLKRSLNIQDDLKMINPFYVSEVLSPHLALERAKIKFDLSVVKEALKSLQARHDLVLIEGAGGVRVPLTRKYETLDLIQDLKAETIIVSRLGLGTINHTLLTIQAVQAKGLKIKGLIFSETHAGAKTLPERTNPTEIERLSGTKVLGIIPFLKSFTEKNILRQCQALKI